MLRPKCQNSKILMLQRLISLHLTWEQKEKDIKVRNLISSSLIRQWSWYFDWQSIAQHHFETLSKESTKQIHCIPNTSSQLMMNIDTTDHASMEIPMFRPVFNARLWLSEVKSGRSKRMKVNTHMVRSKETWTVFWSNKIEQSPSKDRSLWPVSDV